MDISQEKLDRLCAPVGSLILAWSLIDVSVTRITVLIFSIARSRQPESRAPIMFKHRLKVIDRNFKTNTEFSAYANEWPDWRRQITHLQKLRDAIIHGYVSEYEEDGDAYIFHKLDPVKGGARPGRIWPGDSHATFLLRVPYHELSAATLECAPATAALLRISRGLITMAAEKRKSKDSP